MIYSSLVNLFELFEHWNISRGKTTRKSFPEYLNFTLSGFTFGLAALIACLSTLEVEVV
jgi:hypothetical protein